MSEWFNAVSASMYNVSGCVCVCMYVYHVSLQVAVKVIDKKKAREDAYVRKNLRREGKLLQMVHHRNIVRLFEIMETENSYYLVTELCSGGDLMEHICNRKRLDEKESRKYIRQMLSAVGFLHKSGILHR